MLATILILILIIIIAYLVSNGKVRWKGGVIAENCDKLPKSIGEILGPTGVGEVCLINDKDSVIKIMPSTDLSNEVEIQEYLYNNGINVPRIQDAFTCNSKQYIIMSRIIGKTLKEIIEDNELDKIPDDAWKQYADMVYKVSQPDKSKQQGVYHKDVNLGNVMYDGNKFYLIDFGSSELIDYKSQDDVTHIRFEDQQAHYYPLRLHNPRIAEILRTRWDEIDGKFTPLWNKKEELYWDRYKNNPDKETIARIFRKIKKK